MTIKEKVNALIGPSAAAHSELIDALIEICSDDAVNYCNLKEYNPKLDSAVVQMVLEKYNKQGNEGIAASAASTISESYIDGYSKSTLAILNKSRKIKTV